MNSGASRGNLDWKFYAGRWDNRRVSTHCRGFQLRGPYQSDRAEMACFSTAETVVLSQVAFSLFWGDASRCVIFGCRLGCEGKKVGGSPCMNEIVDEYG